METENSDQELKTILEMVLMIIEGSKDKEEAVDKINSLSILQNDIDE